MKLRLPRLPRPPASGAGVAGVTLLAVGVASALGHFFGAGTLATEGVQAALAEWTAGWLDVPWSDPAAPPPPPGVIARKALRGVAFGLGAACLVLGLARATGALRSVTPVLAASAVGLGALDAIVTAVRDELLLHGALLRVADLAGLGARAGRAAGAIAITACGLASCAWALGTSGDHGISLAQLAVEGLTGAWLGALWRGTGPGPSHTRADRGAWAPVAAHAAWSLVLRSGTRAGAAVHTVLAIGAAPAATAWSGGDEGLLAGGAAACASALACAGILGLLARQGARSQPSSRSHVGGG